MTDYTVLELSLKEIDKNYKRNDNETNLYMIKETMKILLKEKSIDFEKELNFYIDRLRK